MADGLPNALGDIGSESILDASISAADLASSSVTTAKIAASAVTTAKLASQSVTADKQNFAGIGSPTTVGNSIQSLDFVSSAGSVATVQFGTAFAAAPNVVAHAVGGLAAQPSVSAGSVVINTTNASASGTIIAIGSGAL